MSRPTITDVAFDEMFSRMAQYGYRHAVRIREDLTAVKANSVGPLTAHIAQVGGQPPLFMVKGPLFPANDLRGLPQVEYVVTITQTFPNSYPILTIEGPPVGWSFKRHPNVDFSGCCFLRSVSSWDPRRSKVVDCVRELQQAFRSNHPFQQNGAPAVAQAQPQLPPQQPLQQQQPQQQPRPAPPVQAPVQQQQPLQAPPVQPLGQPVQPVEAISMPQQTLAMGQVIFGATNAASSRTDGEMERQRERDRQTLAEFQRAQQNDPANRTFATAVANFGQVVQQGAPAAGSVVECPLGFGLHRMVTGPDLLHPLRSPLGVPPPLPPCTDPTPDEHYRQVEEQRNATRANRETHAQSQPKSNSALGSLSRAFNIGAAAVTNLASQAASSVESEMRKSEASSERRRFAQFFPQFANQEQLVAEYTCWSLTGSGQGVHGSAYITNQGIHFTTKRSDNAPVPVVFQFDIPFIQIASLVKGSALNYEWLHLVYDDGLFRSLYNPTTTTAGSIGEFVTTSINGSAYSRMYNWIDHKWRAVRFAGRQGPAPPPAMNPAGGAVNGPSMRCTSKSMSYVPSPHPACFPSVFVVVDRSFCWVVHVCSLALTFDSFL
ncbi:Hypothetical protein, putative [Bodo saltans]|uniref:UEV domain-containing protein n=1 Tax=Bodo saltans TaxID=75058 RepID=A0A0S4KKV9_BODSA|nr:Hypothetical protein, putative [Bodo saltans]|eukprot:CUI15237.1 Hypothetical protein, putative [Bodo saltans]